MMKKQPFTDNMLVKGLNVSLDTLFIANQESPELQNVRFDKGVLKKEFGARAFGTGNLGNYAMFMDSFPLPSGSTQYLFMTPSTIYYLASNDTFQSLNPANVNYTGNEDDNFSSTIGQTAAGNAIYILTNGKDDIQSWNGNTGNKFANHTMDITATAKYVTFFQNRLILGWTEESGTACPTRVRWSVLADPSNFTDTGSGFVELIDTPDWVTGFCIFKNRLFVIKERSIWELVYVGGTTVFSPTRIIDGVGSSVEVLSLGDQLVIYGTDSVYLYDGYTLNPISDQIYPYLYETDSRWVNIAYIGRARVAYIEELEEYWLSVPTEGSSRPNLIFKYNFGTQSWAVTRREVTAFGFYTIDSNPLWNSDSVTWANEVGIWMGDKATSGAPTTLMGNSAGVITEDDRNTYNSDMMVFETKDFKWAHAQRIVEVRIVAKLGEFDVKYSLDEGLTWSDPHTFAAVDDFTEFVLWINETSKTIRVRVETTADQLEIRWIEPWFIPRARTTSLTSS
jgi:hypothetical protein